MCRAGYDAGLSAASREAHDMLARPRRAPYAERLRAHEALLGRGARRLVEICAAFADVRAVYAFGSYATGVVRLRSDLDALVIRETVLRRADRDLDIRKAFDAPVALDLIVVTPDEFERDLPSSSFGQTILKTAKRLDAAE